MILFQCLINWKGQDERCRGWSEETGGAISGEKWVSNKGFTGEHRAEIRMMDSAWEGIGRVLLLSREEKKGGGVLLPGRDPEKGEGRGREREKGCLLLRL